MINRIENEKSVTIYCVLGILFIVASLVANITFPLVVLSVVLLCKVVPLPKLVDYLTVRIVLAVVLQLTLFNIFGLLLHLSKIDVDANIYSVLSIFIVGALFVTQSFNNKIYKINKFSRFDLITAIPVILGMVLLLLYIFSNSLSFSENIIRLMGSSSDQSAHLSMFSDILRNDGNYVYSSDKLSINTPGINSYPMGWHQAMAVLSSSLLSINVATAPFIEVVIVYFICGILTFLLYGISVSVFTGIIFEKIYTTKKTNKIQRREPRVLSEITIKSFIVLINTFLFAYIAFCAFGYVNFVYAVAIVMLCGVLTVGVLKSSDISVGTLSLFALLLFAAVETWYIMGLPLGITFLGLTILYLRKNIKSVFRPRNISILSTCYLLLGIAFLAILHNIMVDGSSSQIMIDNGKAAWLPNELVLLGIVITAIAFVNQKKEDLLYLLINSFFASVLLLTVLNFLNLQEYSYYQQKMVYAFFAICLPLSFMMAIEYLHNKNIKPLVSISVILFVIYTINPVGIISMAAHGMRPTSDSEVRIIDEYFKTKFNDKSKIVFIKDYRKEARPTESYARLLLSKVVSPGDCYNQLIMPLILLGDQNAVDQERENMELGKTATRCFGKTTFSTIADN